MILSYKEAFIIMDTLFLNSSSSSSSTTSTSHIAFQGAIQHVRSYEEKRAKVKEVSRIAEHAAAKLKTLGLPCSIITGVCGVVDR